MEHLFIGGPRDGEMIAVGEDVDFVEWPVSVYERFEYRRETLATPAKSYDVFIPTDWTLDKAMEHLLENYSVNTIATKRASV